MYTRRRPHKRPQLFNECFHRLVTMRPRVCDQEAVGSGTESFGKDAGGLPNYAFEILRLATRQRGCRPSLRPDDPSMHAGVKKVLRQAWDNRPRAFSGIWRAGSITMRLASRLRSLKGWIKCSL